MPSYPAGMTVSNRAVIMLADLLQDQIAQEARQHRHNQADADSVERDSAQNYDQGSVGFHVWPPDQPPLVRLNARILYH